MDINQRITTIQQVMSSFSHLCPKSSGNILKSAENYHNCGFCTACFSGEYPTPVPQNTRKDRFEKRLSESGRRAPKI